MMMRFEGLPGEFSQQDFGEVRITDLDGSREVARGFCSRLKWSRWAAVHLVADFGELRLDQQRYEHAVQLSDTAIEVQPHRESVDQQKPLAPQRLGRTEQILGSIDRAFSNRTHGSRRTADSG